MKIVGVRQAAASLSRVIVDARDGGVVILRHGKPVAVVVNVEGVSLERLFDDDLKDAFARIGICIGSTE